ncbi:MAG: CoA-binding protein [Planctomycetota bacterium]|jgi:predicted CoA-binding protein
MMDISGKPADIRKLLTDAKSVAVVGCSPKADRPSNDITRYLIDAGYEVFPVHPAHDEILGRKCYSDVCSIPQTVDIVDVFLRPDRVPPVVENCIAAGAKSIWMQLGVNNDEAAKRAADAGILVVVEQCIKVAHTVFQIPPKKGTSQ